MKFQTRYLTCIMSLVGLLCARAAFAQLGPTTVQQPVIQVFSSSSTVSVPDRGGIHLGGINRATDSSVTRGVPFGKGPLTTNRGLSSTRSASNISVHATIIDHQELDAAVLAEAAARRGIRGEDATSLAAQQKADYLTRNLARTDKPAVAVSSQSQPSVDELRQRNEQQAANRLTEAAAYFEKAQAAEAEQKFGVAKIYYQMVISRDSSQWKQQAQARLAALKAPAGKTVVSR